ncbi:malate dehydrogenase [Methanohalobium sp.]|uniref:malate dehydrogenase n=1 Tax=Methanohalobium sp. TaxID=2837493 RepID=UPI0025F85A3E|nr:malate dehydrogenase [Methanohalobium sp.]
MTKISVIGAGNVGATAVQRLAELELGDIVMTDIIKGLPQGKALDLMQSAPVMGYDTDITGTNDYKDIEGSDVVVVTAGMPRKPGMSRDDLLDKNANITKDVCENIKTHAPDSTVITVTNPLDIMTYAALEVTGFEHNRVFGMSGVLDSSRFETFIAMELGCSIQDVNAMVLGGHGDLMVPLPQYSTVSGIPITEIMSEDTINRLVERTIHGGAEIVEHLKEGSAFYAPSASIVKMVDSVVNDKKRILPAAAYLNSEYGLNDIYLGVPVKLGKGGVEDIIELDLTDEQKQKLSQSGASVKEEIAKLKL